jgi:hypothetical protein
MGMEDLPKKMDLFMKVSGRKDLNMERENCLFRKTSFMKASFKMD